MSPSSSADTSSRPFAGIEVVEFGQFIAVPFCAQLLAEDGVPATGEAPVADYVCALSLAFGIASALLRRERTGRGGEVEAALMMAALVAQNNSMVRVESVDGAEHAKVRARLAAMRAAGRPFTEQDEIVPSARTPGMVNVYYRTYATKDDVVGVA